MMYFEPGMIMKRREFIQSLGIVGFGSLLPVDLLKGREQILRLSENSDDLLRSLVGKAVSLGAEYADARFVHLMNQNLQMRRDVLSSAMENESAGIALRVYTNGNWGFVAASNPATINVQALAKSAYDQARAIGSLQKVTFLSEGKVKDATTDWSTPMKIDPFTIPIQEKLDFLLSLTERGRKKSDKYYTIANLFLQRRNITFFNSYNSLIKQSFTTIYPNFAYSILNEQTRSFDTVTSSLEPVNSGYELVKDYNFQQEFDSVIQRLEEKASAASISSGNFDIIFAPTAFWRIVYDALAPLMDPYAISGLSGSRPGRAFFEPQDIGGKQMLSPSLSIDYDNNLQGGLSTAGFDDSGRPSRKGTLIANGVLKGVLGSDELAFDAVYRTDPVTKAFTWKSIPHFAMPNLVVRGKENGSTSEDLIAGTEHGLFFSGRGTNMISPDKRVFRAAPQSVYLIEKGKISAMVRDCEIEMENEVFWKNISETGGTTHAIMGADLNPSNDNPLWEHPFSVVTPAVRVNTVPVFDARIRKNK
jgi:TldD protein